ncbi:trypsin-like serine peptidase [Actinosynnema sp. CA-299493]
MRALHRFGVVLAGCVAGIGMMAGPVVAQPVDQSVDAAPAAGNTGSTITSAEGLSAEEYWTPARMAAAITAGPSPVTAGSTAERRGPRPGPRGRVDGALPTVVSPKADIHTMSGRVFFVDDRGGDHSCSGSTVNSGGKRLVFTAGHCVHGGGGGRGWFDVNRWVFVPEYHGGSPFGTWHAYQLWAKTGWIDTANRAFDVAAVVMQPKDGVRIVDAVGGQGIQWGHGYGHQVHMFGYPADPPFDGSGLYYCSGTTWNESGFPTLGCTMTGGASGGPWLDHYGETFWAYLDGVNSWMFWNPDPTHVYKWQSPYFSYDTAGSLFDAVKDM